MIFKHMQTTHTHTSDRRDSVLRGDGTTPPSLSLVENIVITLVQVIQHSMGICVQVKGHEEGVQEVQTIVTDFDQTFQETLYIATVNLRGCV